MCALTQAERASDSLPAADPLHHEDLASWTKGWHDQVYNDEGANPDITLGELLLLYFEWMSVHKVCFVTNVHFQNC